MYAPDQSSLKRTETPLTPLPRTRTPTNATAATWVPRLVQLIAQPTRSGLSVSIVIAADLAGILAAGVIAVFARMLVLGDVTPSTFLNLWPLFGLMVAVNSAFGLYHRVLVNPAQELRRTTIAICVLFLMLTGAMFLLRNGLPYSRAVLLSMWAIALVTVPVSRNTARRIFSRYSWWGHSAVILGAGKTGRIIVDQLLNNPSMGVKPVALFDDDRTKHGTWHGVPLCGRLEDAPLVAKELGARLAIVAMPGVRGEQLIKLVDKHAASFAQVVVIPDLFEFSSLWVSAREMGGVLGLEVRPALLSRGAQFAKRAIDLLAVLVGGLLVLPLVALIALLVKLDSPGPVFFGHSRIGRGGRTFRAWKFRSMVKDSAAALKAHLERHPEARREWELSQKLRNDPRITRVGRFLRVTSLDELPQLWNVIAGDMSLVGPRPIVEDEKRHYIDRFTLYERVRPGLSGLWQVSGRSDTTYAERVRLDSYYVRNWSVWLDLYILARTLPVVIFGRGAR